MTWCTTRTRMATWPSWIVKLFGIFWSARQDIIFFNNVFFVKKDLYECSGSPFCNILIAVLVFVVLSMITFVVRLINFVLQLECIQPFFNAIILKNKGFRSSSSHVVSQVPQDSQHNSNKRDHCWEDFKLAHSKCEIF